MPIVPEVVIPRMFLPQLAALRDAIFVRVLPAFDKLESEADQIEDETFERLGASAGEDTDPADLAEAAVEAGRRHFELTSATRQTVINAFAVALSHLFEQQRHFLSLRTLVDLEPDSKKREKRFRSSLKASGINDAMFIHHRKLEELDLVANVAKHAEGQSAERLRAWRPELFIHPLIRDDPGVASSSGVPVNRPLMGEDLFVQPDDLRAYLDAVESFWRFVLGQLSSVR